MSINDNYIQHSELLKNNTELIVIEQTDIEQTVIEQTDIEQTDIEQTVIEQTDIEQTVIEPINYLTKTYNILRFGTFLQICDLINIDLDHKYFKYYLNPIQINDHKIDCLNEYNIFAKQNNELICIGQNNIFNLNDLMPCQIICMRIQYKSFNNELENFNTQLTNIDDLTLTYINEFKIIAEKIIRYILLKLNYEMNELNYTYKKTLNKIQNTFQYNDIIYKPYDKIVPNFEINSDDEKNYWIELIKKHLAICENAQGKTNKCLVAKHIYNIIHKYIHLSIKHPNFLKTQLAKINELSTELNQFACDLLKLLDGNQDNTEKIYTDIYVFISTLNALARVKMLIVTNNDETIPLIYKISNLDKN